MSEIRLILSFLMLLVSSVGMEVDNLTRGIGAFIITFCFLGVTVQE